MTRWAEVEAQAPDFAGRVQAVFDAHKHKTMATLRRDGSPRISGTEVQFVQGDVWLGSMDHALKARDLQRDPRVAIHSGTIDLELQQGDAKIAGRATEVRDATLWRAVNGEETAPDESHLFRIEIAEVVLTRVDGDELAIESWTPARGLRLVRRR
ncbi:MAG: pyridoxamine 5'-phosphate oxidase [Dehalococcoidia bacterium]|nr:MAG: pyridoxamine 5'-phosphate oxidase [Dehalococcoidia bacterium]